MVKSLLAVLPFRLMVMVLISCGKKLACVEVHSLRIVTINTFGKESFIPI